MPCLSSEPKSTLTVSVMVRAESAAIWISEWKEVMVQPSSACAVAVARAISQRAPRMDRAARVRIGSPYIANSNDRDPARHSERSDHRPRRPRQDDVRGRAPEAEPHLPRQPRRWLADHGHQRPRAR